MENQTSTVFVHMQHFSSCKTKTVKIYQTCLQKHLTLRRTSSQFGKLSKMFDFAIVPVTCLSKWSHDHMSLSPMLVVVASDES